MRRTISQFAAWFAAGVAAVVLASVAVSIVGRQVTGSRPAPLSAAEIEEELAAGGDGATSTTTGSVDGTATTGPATTSTDTTAPGDPSSTTTPSTSPSTPGATTTTIVSAPPAPASTNKTYDLVGGIATLRFSSAGVTVLTATPKSGFSVDVSETHGNGVRVGFESDGHRSRVDAWWEAGPQDEVREDD